MDRAAARDDAGHAFRRHRHVTQQDTGVDCEVVHTLFGLLDQRIPENFPGQVLGLAVDLFERLIDRHRADRYGRVADDPLACLVNVLAGREIHHRVGAPTDRPDHLFDFFLDRGGDRGIADVGIDLHEEVPADDHRLGFRVVDVVRDNRASAGHFVAHEFGGDDVWNTRAPGLAGMLQHAAAMAVGRGQEFFGPCAGLILPDRDEFHFRRDDAFLGIVHLADVVSGFGAERLANMRKPEVGQFRVRGSLTPVLGCDLRKFFRIPATLDPGPAQGRQAGAHINRHVRIGIRTGGVVNRDRLVGRRALAVG